MTDQKPRVSEKTRNLVLLGLFCAIIILMGATPLGFMNIGVIAITLLVIPVAIGAIMLGPRGGAILGAVFGLGSFASCFGFIFRPDPFGAILVGINPVLTFILCLVPRVLVGWLTGLIFSFLVKKIRRWSKTISCIIASICCPLLNTITFVGLLMLLFGKNEEVLGVFGVVSAWGIISVIALNAVVELAVTFVVSAAIARALVHFLPDNDTKADNA
ncbi:MAG: ECF transporter S component [Clostridiales bacterium]|mgnify:CR=1 FL=1|nr:ECF transporter S component [Clostridiales bacterium]